MTDKGARGSAAARRVVASRSCPALAQQPPVREAGREAAALDDGLVRVEVLVLVRPEALADDEVGRDEHDADEPVRAAVRDREHERHEHDADSQPPRDGARVAFVSR